MRTTILIMLLTVVGYLPGLANNHSCEEEQKTDIVLEKGYVEDETKHARTSEYVPLTCYYMQGNIYLNTLSDLGGVTVTITCLETGNSLEATYNSGLGIICIPAFSANGNYMISIVTANNDLYYGYYTI